MFSTAFTVYSYNYEEEDKSGSGTIRDCFRFDVTTPRP